MSAVVKWEKQPPILRLPDEILAMLIEAAIRSHRVSADLFRAINRRFRAITDARTSLHPELGLDQQYMGRVGEGNNMFFYLYTSLAGSPRHEPARGIQSAQPSRAIAQADASDDMEPFSVFRAGRYTAICRNGDLTVDVTLWDSPTNIVRRIPGACSGRCNNAGTLAYWKEGRIHIVALDGTTWSHPSASNYGIAMSDRHLAWIDRFGHFVVVDLTTRAVTEGEYPHTIDAWVGAIHVHRGRVYVFYSPVDKPLTAFTPGKDPIELVDARLCRGYQNTVFVAGDSEIGHKPPLVQYVLDPARDDWCREIHRVETDSDAFFELDIARRGMLLRVRDNRGRVYCLLTGKEPKK